jgi:hypothetical protein
MLSIDKDWVLNRLYNTFHKQYTVKPALVTTSIKQ